MAAEGTVRELAEQIRAIARAAWLMPERSIADAPGQIAGHGAAHAAHIIVPLLLRPTRAFRDRAERQKCRLSWVVSYDRRDTPATSAAGHVLRRSNEAAIGSRLRVAPFVAVPDAIRM